MFETINQYIYMCVYIYICMNHISENNCMFPNRAEVRLSDPKLHLLIIETSLNFSQVTIWLVVQRATDHEPHIFGLAIGATVQPWPDLRVPFGWFPGKENENYAKQWEKRKGNMGKWWKVATKYLYTSADTPKIGHCKAILMQFTSSSLVKESESRISITTYHNMGKPGRSYHALIQVMCFLLIFVTRWKFHVRPQVSSGFLMSHPHLGCQAGDSTHAQTCKSSISEAFAYPKRSQKRPNMTSKSGGWGLMFVRKCRPKTYQGCTVSADTWGLNVPCCLCSQKINPGSITIIRNNKGQQRYCLMLHHSITMKYPIVYPIKSTGLLVQNPYGYVWKWGIDLPNGYEMVLKWETDDH